ncbi:hypothetical protein BKA81DRAFT_399856 [Phyllosticta paracitricarpa]
MAKLVNRGFLKDRVPGQVAQGSRGALLLATRGRHSCKSNPLVSLPILHSQPNEPDLRCSAQMLSVQKLSPSEPPALTVAAADAHTVWKCDIGASTVAAAADRHSATHGQTHRQAVGYRHSTVATCVLALTVPLRCPLRRLAARRRGQLRTVAGQPRREGRQHTTGR